MPIPCLKILAADGTLTFYDADNPVPVAIRDGGLALVDVQILSSGITIAQTPTISAGVAYAANDNIGGLLTFVNAARNVDGGGVIKEIVIVDDASQSAELELWLFDRVFTTGADNAVWIPVEAELENLIDIISTADGTYYTGGATATVAIVEIARRYDLPGGTSLYGRLVTRGAPTYVAVDDLTVKIGMLQD